MSGKKKHLNFYYVPCKFLHNKISVQDINFKPGSLVILNCIASFGCESAFLRVSAALSLTVRVESVKTHSKFDKTENLGGAIMIICF